MSAVSRPAAPLRVAYLSGSPRISTRDEAAVLPGPRSHILGLVSALRAEGHVVDEYVVGDRVGSGVRQVRTPNSGDAGGGWLRQLAVDGVRLATRLPVAWRARKAVTGPHDVAYERFALFQELGRGFQRRGAAWVVETNAVLSQEARRERNALALARLAGWLERRTYRRADLVVCISAALRDLLVAEAGVPAGKIVVIPNAVDPDRFDPDVAPAVPADPGELVVGYVGVVVERQGLDDLIEAVAGLRADGIAASASIVGEGSARPALERLASERGIAGAVRFHGSVPWSDIPAHLASFSVAYSGQRSVAGMPMYHSPLKIYEYLAMGRPVVASRHADAEEALVSSGAGWTFPAGDRDALEGVLRDVAAMGPSELSSFGKRARDHVLTTHTWAHRVEQLLGEIEARGLLR